LGKTVLSQGQTCRAPRAPDMAQPVNGTGDPPTGQTEPPRRCQHRDFHNVPTAGDLGCGKSSPQVAFRGMANATGWGNRAAAYVHTLWTNLWTTSCGRWPAPPDRPRLGQDREARGAHP
jgi:hypothetical protein